jgi:hypothetical protein
MNEYTTILHNFITFAAKELKLKTYPNIRFVGHEEDSKQAFGHNNGAEIVVRIKGRHPIDVMRTIAHELVHAKQGTTIKGDQKREDNANAIAGKIMRKYATTYPQHFKLKNIPEEVVSAVPVNSMGTSSPYNPASAIAQPENVLTAMIKRNKGPRNLRDIVGRGAMIKDLRKDRKSGI